MCGIIGFTGSRPAADILLEGLARLEYRGYDSAGIAVMNGTELTVQKAKGRLENLRGLVSAAPPEGHTGIGHTRWATHGEPSDVNAHPHADESGRIVLVHNGIIENYRSLKAMLIKQGVHFTSETDTEVVVQLLSRAYKGDMIEAIRHTVGQLKGSFALGIVCVDYPGKIFCLRKDSPLIVGVSEDGSFLASDIPAILPYTRTVYMLESEEIAVLSETGVSFCDLLGGKVEKTSTEITWDVKAAEKGGYRHFMMKEIREQPSVIHDTLSPYTEEKNGLLAPANLPLSEEDVRKIGSVTMIGCGTAYHAGLVGQYLLERFVRLHAASDIASEYRYRDPLIEKDELVVVISQSGETADTIAAMRLAQKRGAKVLAVCNVVGSTIAREADYVCHTWAGPEIAVASTKAYVSQLTVLYVLALYFARARGTMSAEEVSGLLKEFFTLPQKTEQWIRDNESRVARFAHHHFDRSSVFFLGRGLDCKLAMEASLKLKEISYIHSEAYAAGELKHGTIALIEPGTLVVALSTQDDLREKMIGNVTEVKVRGAKILLLTAGDADSLDQEADEVLRIPDTLPLLRPIVSILPLQLFAYYMALERGCDIDKPRNLAKSVTVE